MNKKRTIIWAIAGALTLVILLLAVTGVWAEPTQTSMAAPSAPLAVFSDTITFQGRLLDNDGNPVDGSPAMTFRLYTQAEEGAPVWEDAYNVPVADGLFNANLEIPSALFDGQALWLGVHVEGDAQEMQPRQQLLPAPYALYAKVAPWNGLVGVPSDLADGDDDTLYSAGTGLSLVGTQFSIALAYRLPQGCANGAIAEWNAASDTWDCGSDDVGSGAAAWLLGGNAGTTPGTDILGTTDAVSLTMVVNAVPALRLEPAAVPNLIGGYRGNGVTSGVQGATIGGGGSTSMPNRVTDDYGTVGGGEGNQAGDDGGTGYDASYSTVGGGRNNTASGEDATIGGGYNNTASGDSTTIGGGDVNTAGGDYATVGGGYGNVVTATRATVGGGVGNTASGSDAIIGGGYFNTASGNYAAIGGGHDNTASSGQATVGGGRSNNASGYDATIGGGYDNIASGGQATVSGGWSNTASSDRATVGGGYYNQATAKYATIAGGGPSDPVSNPTTTNNRVYDDYGTIGGGGGNQAGSDDDDSTGDIYATVGGGIDNTASGRLSTVSGGYYNTTDGLAAIVGGGANNTASGDYAAVSGGEDNIASGDKATVGGGYGNTASGWHAATVGGGAGNTADGLVPTVGGGTSNTASGWYATIGGGAYNTASGESATISGGQFISVTGQAATVAGGSHITVTGAYATVPGGQYNVASGDHSFAAGYGAQANHYGSFVWSDSRSTAAFASQHHYQFRARAFGGFRFEDGENLWVELSYLPTSPISTSTGAYLTGGGVWTNNSDRNLKENFEPVDRQDVLDRLAELPISTWNYKAGDPNARHMGPVAQDFYAIFGLGEDDRHIAAMDTSGIALAAIQGLHTKNQVLEAEVSALKTENATLKKDLNDLEARVAALEQTGTSHPAPILATWWPLGGFVVLAGIVVARQRRQEDKR